MGYRYVFVFLLALLLVSCSEESIAGKALQVRNIDAIERTIIDTITPINVQGQYIWNKAYFFNSNQWTPINLNEKVPGTTTNDGKWIKNEAFYSYDKLTTVDPKLLVYYCNKINNQWDCNNNKWVTILPEEPVIPEVPLGSITTDDINVKDHNAKGDGLTDDTVAIQNALNEAVIKRTAVYFPKGTYLVSSMIHTDLASFSHIKALRITGDDATLKAINNIEAIMSISQAAHFTMQGLTFDANDLALHGLKLWKMVYPSTIIRDITVENAVSHGLFLNQTQLLNFYNVVSSNNGGDGFYCIDCNGAWFDYTSSLNNGGSGYNFRHLLWSGYVYLNSVISEGNQEHGILFDTWAQGGGIVHDAWVKNNIKDGIRLDTFNTVVTDSQIQGVGDGSNRAVRIAQGNPPWTGGTRVFNNQILGTGDPSYQVAVDESPSPAIPADASNTIQNNVYGSINSAKPVPQPEKIDLPDRVILNVKDFGADGSDNLDDTVALQNSFNQGMSSGVEVYLPRGEYLVSSNLQVNNNLEITGEWALIKATAVMQEMMSINEVTNFEMKRIVFLGDELASNGVHIVNGNGNVVFQQVTTRDTLGDGFVIENSAGITVKNSVSGWNDGAGFYCINCNDILFNKNTAVFNNGNGIMIQSGSGNTLTGVDSEVNKGHGVVIKSDKTVLSDTWSEGNEMDPIVVEGDFNIIKNSRMLPSINKINTRAVRIKSGSGHTISGNNFAAVNLTPRTIKDESGQSNTYYLNVYGWAASMRNLYLIQDQNNPCPASTLCIEK
jgi:hypothetical protein